VQDVIAQTRIHPVGRSIITLMPTSDRYVSIREVEQYQWRVATNDIPLTVPVKGTQLSLAAAIELACFEQFLFHTNDENKLRIRFPTCGVWKLIRSLRWPNGNGTVKENSTVLSVLPQDSGRRSSDSLRSLQTDLRQHGFSHTLAGSLTGAAGEIIDNVFQHSQTELPGLFGYQLSRRKVTFCVADLGVGVLKSLRQNPQYRHLMTSMDALQTAIAPGVSRFDAGGYGFSTLLRSVAELWGKTRLRSGEAVLVFDRETEERRKMHSYLPPFLGVQVSAICRLDPPKKS
jgi:anti-sigma regulatory factor (Ser/Thr protein kinase)